MASLARRATQLRRVARKIGLAALTSCARAVRAWPVERDLVVYESFAGNGMLCNPEAIFRALLADPEQQHLRHVWVLADLGAYASSRGGVQARRSGALRPAGVARVRPGAGDGRAASSTTRPSRPTGASVPGRPISTRGTGRRSRRWATTRRRAGGAPANVLRNLMMADYLLSTSEFMSEQMYEHAYRLVNIAPGRLVEVGYPRTDLQFGDERQRAATRARLRSEGVVVADDQSLVLLAPTWKGESFHTPRNDAADLAVLVDELEQLLPAGHRVLLKVHQQVYAFAAAEPRLAGRLVPNHLPTNAVLGITDVLVTDYSSIFFDFLARADPSSSTRPTATSTTATAAAT